MTPRIKEQYEKEVLPALIQKFSYSNVMMAPRLEKISVNIGVGEANQSPNLLEDAFNAAGAEMKPNHVKPVFDKPSPNDRDSWHDPDKVKDWKMPAF